MSKYGLSFTDLDRGISKWKRKDRRALKKMYKQIDKKLKKLGLL